MIVPSEQVSLGIVFSLFIKPQLPLVLFFLHASLSSGSSWLCCQHSSCRTDKPRRLSYPKTPFKQIICSHSGALVTLGDSRNCQDWVGLCPCRCFPKEAVVCQYLRDRVGYRGLFLLSRNSSALSMCNRVSSLLRRECGFAFCSSVGGEGHVFLPFFTVPAHKITKSPH